MQTAKDQTIKLWNKESKVRNNDFVSHLRLFTKLPKQTNVMEAFCDIISSIESCLRVAVHNFSIYVTLSNGVS